MVYVTCVSVLDIVLGAAHSRHSAVLLFSELGTCGWTSPMRPRREFIFPLYLRKGLLSPVIICVSLWKLFCIYAPAENRDSSFFLEIQEKIESYWHLPQVLSCNKAENKWICKKKGLMVSYVCTALFSSESICSPCPFWSSQQACEVGKRFGEVGGLAPRWHNSQVPKPEPEWDWFGSQFTFPEQDFGVV